LAAAHVPLVVGFCRESRGRGFGERKYLLVNSGQIVKGQVLDYVF